MKNINHTRSSISDDIRNILCSSANMRRAIPLILRLRSEERFNRNAETDLVCRLLLEKKNAYAGIALPNPASIALHEKFGFKRVALFSDQGRNFGLYFFFNDTATPEIYTLSLHDALPIYQKQHQ